MGLVREETEWLSNAPELLEAASRLCQNRGVPKEQWTHEHVHLVGGRVAACERYPPEMVVSILRGLRRLLE